MTLDDLLARDGDVCLWCGRRPWRRDLTVEHVMPRARSGRTVPENLTVACRGCNRRRGTRPVVAFVRAQLDAGSTPRADLVTTSLTRLASSPSPDLARYGRRQLALFARLGVR